MRALLGFFFYLILVFPLILGTLMLAAVGSSLFNRQFYVDTLGNPDFYQVLLDDALPETLQADFFVLETSGDGLPAEALSLALREIVTPQYLAEQVGEAVNEVFDLLHSGSSTLNLSFDLLPIKEALAGPQGEDFARVLAENLPACEPGQEPRTESGAIPRCLSQAMTAHDAQQDILTALPTAIETLPDTVAVAEDINLGPEFQDAAPAIGFFFGAGVVISIVTSAVLAFVLWLVNAMLAAGGRRMRLLWLGWTLLLPALIVLSVGALLTALVDPVLLDVSTDLSAATREAITSLGQTVLGGVVRGFLLSGGISAAVAALLMFWGAIARPAYADGRKSKRSDGFRDDDLLA